jgi:hypothetical protein
MEFTTAGCANVCVVAGKRVRWRKRKCTKTAVWPLRIVLVPPRGFLFPDSNAGAGTTIPSA